MSLRSLYSDGQQKDCWVRFLCDGQVYIHICNSRKQQNLNQCITVTIIYIWYTLNIRRISYKVNKLKILHNEWPYYFLASLIWWYVLGTPLMLTWLESSQYTRQNYYLLLLMGQTGQRGSCWEAGQMQDSESALKAAIGWKVPKYLRPSQLLQMKAPDARWQCIL